MNFFKIFWQNNHFFLNITGFVNQNVAIKATTTNSLFHGLAVTCLTLLQSISTHVCKRQNFSMKCPCSAVLSLYYYYCCCYSISKCGFHPEGLILSGKLILVNCVS